MKRSRWTEVTLPALALLLVGLLNGSGFYLRRIGLLDQRTYRAELQQFCDPPIPRFWLPSRCRAATLLSIHPLQIRLIPFGRLHQNLGPFLALKLAKLVLLAGLVAEGLRRWLSPAHWFNQDQRKHPPTGRHRLRVPDRVQLAPALPLLISTGLSLAISVGSTPGPQLLVSLASVGWLLLLPLGGWLSRLPVMVSLAQAVAALLALQVPLVLLEAMRGLPMAFGPWTQNIAPLPFALPSRLVGSFVHPNSLGAAVVCGFGFCLAYLPQRRLLPWLVAIGLVLVLAARSAAGLLGMSLLGLWWCRPARRLPWPLLASVLVGLLLLFLPATSRLLGRPDLLQSLSGRLGMYPALLDPTQLFHLLFGRGLAVYSNQLASWLGPGHPLFVSFSDGMPALLLLQGGLLALGSFYGLLWWAWHRDRRGRPFLLAITLTSLTLNVTELTPFGLLFGIALNRALLLPPTRHWLTVGGTTRTPAGAVHSPPDL